MSIFSRDKNADHLALVQEWLRGEPISRAVMETVWRGEDEGEYEPTLANYRPAVSTMLRHLWDKGDVPEPQWFSTLDETYGITPIGARLIDALAFHVAHIYGVEERGWSVILDQRMVKCGEAMVGDSEHRSASTTVFAALYWADGGVGASRFQFPFNVVPELARRASPDALPQDSDAVLAKVRRASAPRLGGLLGKGAPTWEIDVPPPLAEAPPVAVIEEIQIDDLPLEELIANVYPSDRPGFTYLVFVHEAAPHQWGEVAYGKYEAALGEQPGIDAVEGEDKEQFYVLAPTLTADEVLAAARAAAPQG